MNTQNIIALGKQLEELGIDNRSYALLKRICFHPQCFSLTHIVNGTKEQYHFFLFFERVPDSDKYLLKYYDAVLRRQVENTAIVINGINPAALDESMQNINWKEAFNFDEQGQWQPELVQTWQREKRVYDIMEQFTTLEETAEGKAAAVLLKNKYWSGVASPEICGNTGSVKAKGEVSQRFYIAEGRPAISVEEACRFLQNKWLEKEMQWDKRKQAGANGETDAPPATANRSGLLNKKRRLKPSTNK
jgi:hypothetical protein